MSEFSPTTPRGEQAGGTSPRKLPLGELLFALSGVLAGAVVMYAASGIRIPPGSTNTIGPREFPYAVAALLTLASIVCLINVLRGQTGQAEEGEDVDVSAGTDWVTVIVLCVIFVVFGLLIQPIGWPLAVTVLFAGTAWKLGAPRLWRAVLIGFLMGLITQYLFGGLLGISLPAGVLFDWIPIFHG